MKNEKPNEYFVMPSVPRQEPEKIRRDKLAAAKILEGVDVEKFIDEAFERIDNDRFDR